MQVLSSQYITFCAGGLGNITFLTRDVKSSMAVRLIAEGGGRWAVVGLIRIRIACMSNFWVEFYLKLSLSVWQTRFGEPPPVRVDCTHLRHPHVDVSF